MAGPPAILVNRWADPAYRLLILTDDGPPINFAQLGRIGDAALHFRRQGDLLEWQPELWGPVVSIGSAGLPCSPATPMS